VGDLRRKGIAPFGYYHYRQRYDVGWRGLVVGTVTRQALHTTPFSFVDIVYQRRGRAARFALQRCHLPRGVCLPPHPFLLFYVLRLTRRIFKSTAGTRARSTLRATLLFCVLDGGAACAGRAAVPSHCRCYATTSTGRFGYSRYVP